MIAAQHDRVYLDPSADAETNLRLYAQGARSSEALSEASQKLDKAYPWLNFVRRASFFLTCGLLLSGVTLARYQFRWLGLGLVSLIPGTVCWKVAGSLADLYERVSDLESEMDQNYSAMASHLGSLTREIIEQATRDFRKVYPFLTLQDIPALQSYFDGKLSAESLKYQFSFQFPNEVTYTFTQDQASQLAQDWKAARSDKLSDQLNKTLSDVVARHGDATDLKFEENRICSLAKFLTEKDDPVVTDQRSLATYGLELIWEFPDEMSSGQVPVVLCPKSRKPRPKPVVAIVMGHVIIKH